MNGWESETSVNESENQSVNGSSEHFNKKSCFVFLFADFLLFSLDSLFPYVPFILSSFLSSFFHSCPLAAVPEAVESWLSSQQSCHIDKLYTPYYPFEG